jgi:hypothetical protein
LFKDDLFQKIPYNRFGEFVSLTSDRFALLCSILDECSLPRTVLEIEGKRHIIASNLVNSSLRLDSSIKSVLIFTAHYDRAPHSPGANDNGAAVFQLMETAIRLDAQNTTTQNATMQNDGRGTLFIFTDGEELAKGENLRLQGSYSLGLYLKKSGLGNSPVFTFDACGAGDTLIISTAADQLLRNESGAGAEAARRKVQALRQRALDAARRARLEKVLLLPTPFSEDAGFLLAGMAAQTIAVLPHSEAALVRGEELINMDIADRRRIPETWRSLNGPGDSPLKLTPEHWKKVSAFAGALAEI